MSIAACSALFGQSEEVSVAGQAAGSTFASPPTRLSNAHLPFHSSTFPSTRPGRARWTQYAARNGIDGCSSTLANESATPPLPGKALALQSWRRLRCEGTCRTAGLTSIPPSASCAAFDSSRRRESRSMHPDRPEEFFSPFAAEFDERHEPFKGREERPVQISSQLCRPLRASARPQTHEASLISQVQSAIE